MSSHSKTRKVTELGRLVTRGQLQSVVNQIGQQLATAIEKAIAPYNARLGRIEARLDELSDGAGLPHVSDERKLELVSEPKVPA